MRAPAYRVAAQMQMHDVVTESGEQFGEQLLPNWADFSRKPVSLSNANY